MPFFQMDDGFDSEERVGRAGTAAFGLYSRCGVWVARNLKDGFVPDWIAAQYGSAEWARKLVEAGLWVAVDGGFMMPDYLTTHRNRTRARVEEERAMKAVRQANWLAAKGKKGSSKSKSGSSRDTRQGNGASRDASQDGPLTPAQPLPSPKGEGVDAAPRSGGAAPPTQTPTRKLTTGRVICATHHLEVEPGSACRGCASDALAVDDLDLDQRPPARNGQQRSNLLAAAALDGDGTTTATVDDAAIEYGAAQRDLAASGDAAWWRSEARRVLDERGHVSPKRELVTVTAAELYRRSAGEGS